MHVHKMKLDYQGADNKSVGDAVQFLPRDAMHKRGLCRHAVSVCLSRS